MAENIASSGDTTAISSTDPAPIIYPKKGTGLPSFITPINIRPNIVPPLPNIRPNILPPKPEVVGTHGNPIDVDKQQGSLTPNKTGSTTAYDKYAPENDYGDGKSSTVPYDKYAPENDYGTTSITDTSVSSSPEEKGANIIKYTPSENVLHNFATYTYSLSLHILTPEDYKELMNNPNSPYVPKNVLITSAGKFGDDFKRNLHFKEDFFFDKLEMETVIGFNSQTRNSNAVTIDFTIIEPYGMTLLNRILKLSDDITAGNYMELPYVIQVDFYGSDDSGIPTKLEKITKVIPIRIIGMKMKVGIKGAQYDISAVAFNHQAFQETLATAPIKLEITAGNVKDFFLANTGADVVPVDEKAADQYRETSDRANALAQKRLQINNRIKEIQTEIYDPVLTREPINTEYNNLKSESDKIEKMMNSYLNAPVEAKSYTGAINAWLSQLQEDGEVLYKDQIRFEIDEDIANATFPTADLINKNDRKFSEAKEKQNGFHTKLNDNTTVQIAINAGTNIIEVIGLAIRNSSYITKQVKDATMGEINETNLKKLKRDALNWFKIIPRIELGKYDKKNNRYSKTIIYKIKKYVVHNTKSEDAPQGLPDGYCKEYDYIFTGNNNDILNFDLNFDTLFYIARSAKPANKAKATGEFGEPLTDSSTTKSNERMLTKSEVDKSRKTYGINELRNKVYLTAGTTNSMTTSNNSKPERIVELQKNILMTPGGDMCNVHLTIIGDPDFIKQDDLYMTSENKNNNNKTNNGSLITDASELFVKLTFKTPGDYDKHGLAVPSIGEYTIGIFSGIFRVVTVKNTFSSGKFQQELTLVRFDYQETLGIDSTPDEANSQDERLAPTVETDTRTGLIEDSAFISNTSSPTVVKTEPQLDYSNIPAPSSALPQLGISTAQPSTQGSPGNPINIDGIQNTLISNLTGQITNAVSGISKQIANAVPGIESLARPFAEITKNMSVISIGQGPIGNAVVGSENDPTSIKSVNPVTGGEVYSGRVDDNGTPMPVTDGEFQTLSSGQRMAFRRAGGKQPI